MKIVTEQEVKERIENKWPNQPFEILKYTKITEPFTIKCLKCGQTKTYANTSNYLRSTRLGICSCYNEKNHFTRHNNNKEKILKLIEKKEQTFCGFGYKEETKKYTVKVECPHCQQTFVKTWADYLKHAECPFCENKQKMNTQAFKSLLPEEYELLSEYTNTDCKILVRHNCGFIWKISAHGFLTHTGCPKCNKHRSMGEKRIGQLLDELKIPYSIEQSFSWQTNLKRRYDFYLPEQNLVIEYMGEQHYRDRSLFKVTLEEQQAIDKEKKEDAIKNGLNYLAICYKDYIRLPIIINNIIGSTTSFNNVDSSESKE